MGLDNFKNSKSNLKKLSLAGLSLATIATASCTRQPQTGVIPSAQSTRTRIALMSETPSTTQQLYLNPASEVIQPSEQSVVIPEFEPTQQVHKTELPFQWEKGPQMYASYHDSDGNLVNRDMYGNTITGLFRTTTYNDGSSLAEIMQSAFAPGGERVLVTTNNSNDVIIQMHSGYERDQSGNYFPLEAEPLRFYLEGNLFANYAHFEDIPSDELQNIYNQIDQNITKLIGGHVKILQGTGKDTVTQIFQIKGVSYVPHNAVEEFEANTQVVSAYAQLYDPDNPIWTTSKNSNKQFIILVFCGWGGYDDEGKSVFTRYIFVLEPIDQPES